MMRMRGNCTATHVPSGQLGKQTQDSSTAQLSWAQSSSPPAGQALYTVVSSAYVCVQAQGDLAQPWCWHVVMAPEHAPTCTVTAH